MKILNARAAKRGPGENLNMAETPPNRPGSSTRPAHDRKGHDMRIQQLACGFVMGIATALFTGLVLSQEYEVDKENAHRRWEKYNTPSESHKKLKGYVGEWDVVMKLWMDGGGEPMISHGEMDCELIFGGRFIKTDVRATTMIEYDGKVIPVPFEGLGITGYDTLRKKYVAVWIDNFTNSISICEGQHDKSGKVFTFFGKQDDWMDGVFDKPYKIVDRWVTDDKCISEMYDLTASSGDGKFLELVATRKSTQVQKD